MKRQIQYISIALIISLFNICAYAQAPSISYPQPSYTLVTGTNINSTFGTNIIPTNTGGAVANANYLSVTTPVSAGDVNNAQGLTSDGAGNIYEADQGGDIINKITGGTVTKIAGSGTAGEANGNGNAAKFNNPSGIVYDGAGFLYVTDNGGNTIRKVSTTAPFAVTTIAGGTAGELNGNGTAARFNGPAGITYDKVGKFLYVADNGGNTIRKISTVTPFAVTTLAGSGTAGELPGTGTAAQFNKPAGIVYDGSANLYVTDNAGNTVRKIVIATGVVSTFAGSGIAGAADGTGTGATFSAPWGITIDAVGNLYIADEGNNLIRKITVAGAVVTTIAGSGNQAETNGTGIAAEFYSPYSIVVDNTNLFVGDSRQLNLGPFGSFSLCTVRQIPLSGYIISPDLPSNLNFDGTGTISGKSTTGFAPTNFTVSAYNLSGSGSTIVTLTCGQTINWTGAAGGANGIRWDKTGNWDTGTVPTGGDDVRIGVSNTNFTNFPTINTTTGSQEVGTLTFGNKKSFPLTINTSDLKVNEGITVNNGSTTTTITGTGSLTMAPGASLAFTATTNKLTILTTGFTLQSDATGSASIGQVLTVGNFTGTSLSNVTVERYLQGGAANERGYRLLSSPVYAATVGGNHVYSINYIKGTAVLTGTDGTAGGFDAVGNPTLYLYRENMIGKTTAFTAGNFRGVKNISASPNYEIDLDGTTPGITPFNIPAGNGFLLFFRGGPGTVNPTITTSTPNQATLSTSGTLNVGPVTVKDWFTPASSNLSYTATSGGVAGFNCIGNPYACAIDLTTFTTTNNGTGIFGSNLVGGANPTIWVYDPISKTFGTLQNTLPPSSAFASNIIASGQGFFVRAARAGAQVTFYESAKSPQSQNTGPQLLMSKKPVALASFQFLRLQFGVDSLSGEQAVINFNSQAPLAYTDKFNTTHIQGSGAANLSILSADLVDLSVHSVPFPGQLQSQTVKLNINAAANGTYILKMRDLVAVPKLFDLWLMDAYKKDSVNLRKANSYSVDINKADSASFGSNRLTLVIRQNAALAYKLLDFTAGKTQTGHNVEVRWKTENEENYTNFTVQRSIDNGRTFDVLGSVKANGSGSYNFVDKNPGNQRNFYRLKQEDLNNNITFSNVVEVQFDPFAWDKLRIFPNPATHTINLSIDERNDQKGYYSIRFVNSSGRVVKEFSSSQPQWQANISYLQPGSYLVRVINTKTQNLVGESKFVKL